MQGGQEQSTKQDCDPGWRVASPGPAGKLCRAKSTTDWPPPDASGPPWRRVIVKDHAQEKGSCQPLAANIPVAGTQEHMGDPGRAPGRHFIIAMEGDQV